MRESLNTHIVSMCCSHKWLFTSFCTLIANALGVSSSARLNAFDRTCCAPEPWARVHSCKSMPVGCFRIVGGRLGIAHKIITHATPKVGSRLPAEDRIVIPGHGRIVYYEYSGNIVAECKQDGHRKCFKTRTTFPGRRAAQGRPLGHLCAWLLHSGCSDQASHLQHKPDVATRQAARAYLKEVEGGGKLFLHERPKLAGEMSEPEGLA